MLKRGLFMNMNKIFGRLSFLVIFSAVSCGVKDQDSNLTATAAQRLRCMVFATAKNLENPKDRYDIFDFEDLASPSGKVTWISWVKKSDYDNNSIDGIGAGKHVLNNLRHVATREMMGYEIEASTGKNSGSFFKFQTAQIAKDAIRLKIESKTPVGGSPKYIKFGEKDGQCRVVSSN